MSTPVHSKHLDSDDQRQLREHCRDGYRQLDGGDTDGALRQFYAAWLLIPKPQTEWTESGWVLMALADAYLAKRSWQQAGEALRSSQHCPDMATHPLLHLRLAQVCLELSQPQEARKHVAVAVREGGEDILERMDARYRQQLSV